MENFLNIGTSTPFFIWSLITIVFTVAIYFIIKFGIKDVFNKKTPYKSIGLFATMTAIFLILTQSFGSGHKIGYEDVIEDNSQYKEVVNINVDSINKEQSEIDSISLLKMNKHMRMMVDDSFKNVEYEKIKKNNETELKELLK